MLLREVVVVPGRYNFRAIFQSSQSESIISMRKIIDRDFEYEGVFKCRSKCHLTIWGSIEDGFRVLFTELDSNPGTSVTNRSEHLANEVSAMLGHPENIEWFETYPMYDNRYDQIVYDGKAGKYCNPSWIGSTWVDLDAKI